MGDARTGIERETIKVRPPLRLPPEKAQAMAYIQRLEWYNLGLRISIVTVLFFALGNSQAAKAAWLEDTVALLPPIAFLIGMRIRNRAPTDAHPYGFQTVMNIAFLTAASALAAMGLFLIIDALLTLISREHPTIGGITVFGHTIWFGWVMIAALVYSVIPPVIIGYFQEKAAVKVHEKTVYADARMSRADWMTGLAAVVGILGVGFGWWWADAVAAGVIGLDVARDGLTNVREAAGNLISRRPHVTADRKPERIIEELEHLLEEQPWVERAAVRLREEGHVFSGEAFVVPRSEEQLVRHLADAQALLQRYDWRIYEVVVTAVEKLD